MTMVGMMGKTPEGTLTSRRLSHWIIRHSMHLSPVGLQKVHVVQQRTPQVAEVMASQRVTQNSRKGELLRPVLILCLDRLSAPDSYSKAAAF